MDGSGPVHHPPDGLVIRPSNDVVLAGMRTHQTLVTPRVGVPMSGFLPVAPLGGGSSEAGKCGVVTAVPWAIQPHPVMGQVGECGGGGNGAEREDRGSACIEHWGLSGAPSDVDNGLYTRPPCAHHGCGERVIGFLCGRICESDGPQGLFQVQGIMGGSIG